MLPVPDHPNIHYQPVGHPAKCRSCWHRFWPPDWHGDSPKPTAVELILRHSAPEVGDHSAILPIKMTTFDKISGLVVTNNL